MSDEEARIKKRQKPEQPKPSSKFIEDFERKFETDKNKEGNTDKDPEQDQILYQKRVLKALKKKIFNFHNKAQK